MFGFGWIATVLFGALAGWIASGIMKARLGLFASILVGILGAVIANAVLLPLIGMPVYGHMGGRGMGFGLGVPGYMLLWQLGGAVIGASALIFLMRAIRN